MSRVAGRESVHHHVGLRVSELDRAVRFYVEAFDMRLRYEAVLESEFISRMLQLPPQTTGRAAFLSFGDHSCIELFEFVPSPPVRRAEQVVDGIIHVGVLVDDVGAALERVVTLGGRVLVPTRGFATHQVAFCEDFDGHVLELLDATVDDCAALAGSDLPDVSDVPEVASLGA